MTTEQALIQNSNVKLTDTRKFIATVYELDEKDNIKNPQNILAQKEFILTAKEAYSYWDRFWSLFKATDYIAKLNPFNGQKFWVRAE